MPAAGATGQGTVIRQAPSPGRARLWRRARLARLAAGFALMVASGLVWNTFGLFLVAIEAEFQTSRAGISGAFGAFALTNALCAPLVGMALGRWNSRLVLAGLSLLLGLALLLTAFSQGVASYWLLFGIVGGIGSHCFSSFVVFTVLVKRFRDRPATAMAIADAGSGLAAFLGLPLVQIMIVQFGWRATYIVIGLIVGLMGAVLHLKVLDRVPTAPTGTTASVGGRRAALASVAFVALAVSYFCGSAAYQGLMTQQIALTTESGLTFAQAAWVAAWAGLVVFIWRLMAGWLCDRWSLAGVMVLAGLAAVVTFSALGIGLAGAPDSGRAGLWIYPLTMGVAFGGTQVLLAMMTRRIAKAHDYPVILGFGRLASGLGMAVGPVMAGHAHDVAGNYHAAIVLLLVLSIVHFATFTLVTFRARAV